MKYHTVMNYEVITTEKFERWLRKLRDKQAKKSIATRIVRIQSIGDFGDHKQLSEKLWELRFFTGKGYRVYYTFRGNEIVLLLCAGDKSNKKGQNEDIKTALDMITHLAEE